ncbi:hypothetical protein PV08_06041 [Exophiala spinifera]|uniref:Mediator of RNA polymerase II transcription subunit 10 n=1 Tax=Exophiala spinifera TaxID=91928 RepID=A0A0D2BBM8_9EURO|nr:uncharacterized protein PV08_06041 [Exophiala spinifera]KIW15990.1 hypothetical protein PV08_06041 [Exophiala spinifera]
MASHRRGLSQASETVAGSTTTNRNTAATPTRNQGRARAPSTMGRHPPNSVLLYDPSQQEKTTSTTLYLSPDKLRRFPPGSCGPFTSLKLPPKPVEVNAQNPGSPSAATSTPSLVADSPSSASPSTTTTPVANEQASSADFEARSLGKHSSHPGLVFGVRRHSNRDEALAQTVQRKFLDLLAIPSAGNIPQQDSSPVHYETFPQADDMAPVKDPSNVHSTIKDIIQHLYEIQMQTHGYVPETQDLLVDKMTDLAESLAQLQTLTSPRESPHNPIHTVQIAPEIVDYVDDGRNPDIFTRDFVENVQRGNAVINGKQQAFREFSEIYAKALKEGIPGISRQVDAVMESVGFSSEDHEPTKESNLENTKSESAQ